MTSPAFPGDNDAARAYGVAGFFEMLDGYLELDYAFLDDRTSLDRSYHNIGLGLHQRYFSFLSNSMRSISNLARIPTASTNGRWPDLLLFENSLITQRSLLVRALLEHVRTGFGRVQSVARNGAAGGILRNTGILFETDNLTGYPTLDPTGMNTFGGALGVNSFPPRSTANLWWSMPT